MLPLRFAVRIKCTSIIGEKGHVRDRISLPPVVTGWIQEYEDGNILPSYLTSSIAVTTIIGYSAAANILLSSRSKFNSSLKRITGSMIFARCDGVHAVKAIDSHMKKNTTVYVDGVETDSDVPVELNSGRTYVPLRFLAQALGLNVEWDSESGVIDIDEETPDEETSDEETPDEETPDDESGT